MRIAVQLEDQLPNPQMGEGRRTMSHIMKYGQVAVVLPVLLAMSGCPDPDPNADAGDTGVAVDGEAGPGLGLVGDPCLSDLDCVVQAPGAHVACLRRSWGFTDGYCAVVGLTDESACRMADPSSTLVELPCSEAVCMSHCESSEDCRAGYECFLGIQACWPRCVPGRACPVPPPSLCAVDEDCNDGDNCTTDGCVDGICAYDRVTERPRRAARFATLGTAYDLDFYGRIDDNSLQLVVAEGEDGVEVFDLSNPTSPQVYFSIDTVGPAVAAYRAGERLVVAEEEFGIEVFDSTSGALLGSSEIEFDDGVARAVGFARGGADNAYVAVYQSGVVRVNLSNFNHGDACDTRGRAVHGVHLRDFQATLVADSLAGLAVCSWVEGTSEEATQIERIDTEGRMLALSQQGDIMATAEAGAGFSIFDVLNPIRPERRYESGVLEDEVLDVHMTGTSTLAVAAADEGLFMFALEDCFEPVLWYHWETDGPALALDEADGVLAIGLGEAGVELLDLGCRQIESD